jgi:hypothetical protein
MTTAQRSTANRLIEAKGQTVTLTRRTLGAYNVSTGTASVSTTTETGKGVILPLAGYRKVGIGNIAPGDETLLLSALLSDGTAMTIPELGETITTADAIVREIVAVDPLRPDGAAIFYDCVVRSFA